MHSPAPLTTREHVVDELARSCFAPSGDDPVMGLIGLEAELFVLRLADRARTSLEQLVGAIDDAPGLRRDPSSERPAWVGPAGIVTEEPGGQLELITRPEPTVDTALSRLEALADVVARPLRDRGLTTGGTGLDPFNPPETLDVQLDAPRYEAMGTYFSRRGTSGRALLCASASLQVNLDLGPPDVAARRWLAANLMAPIVVATFANSPTTEAVNGRALAWMRLDPTRTGVPAIIATGEDDPVQHLAWDVLRADVMLIARDDQVHAGRPGFTFADWVTDGHPRFGRPTAEDLQLHLSTLFPEVRLRGFLEVRGIDQLPRHWRPAPVVLLAGLLYDGRATDEALALLEPARRDLPRLQDRAIRRGLTDPLVWELAGPLWEIALEGARRLGEDYVGAWWLARAEDFVARFTRRRRHPADEQREMRRRGAQEALEWSS